MGEMTHKEWLRKLISPASAEELWEALEQAEELRRILRESATVITEKELGDVDQLSSRLLGARSQQAAERSGYRGLMAAPSDSVPTAEPPPIWTSVRVVRSQLYRADVKVILEVATVEDGYAVQARFISDTGRLWIAVRWVSDLMIDLEEFSPPALRPTQAEILEAERTAESAHSRLARIWVATETLEPLLTAIIEW
jgi:hypothetical protein